MQISSGFSREITEFYKGNYPKVELKTSSPFIEEESKRLNQEQGTKGSRESLEQHISSMNDLLESQSTTIRFNVHEDLHRWYVQVIDQVTDEVVKEIPPEQFLDMIASMLKHVGLIVDKRV
ncbi:flagellar biosynthesis protein FlaG [bacterium LRH843]|nr:flagellar biosynthesis protein FlaG [bacterium LRH843]